MFIKFINNKKKKNNSLFENLNKSVNDDEDDDLFYFLTLGEHLIDFPLFFVSQKTLEAFMIILAFFQLLYLLSLHAGILGSNYGPTYGAAAPGTGVGPKTPNVGTPAASAV
jgi:hypothetical protein